jgi:hypothetical protein
LEHKEKVNTRMGTNPTFVSTSASSRFAAWLEALRGRHGHGMWKVRTDSSALDILARNLPCQKSDGKPTETQPCPGVVAARLGGERAQPFSFLCPCKLYESTLSKYDALALVGLPWESVEREGATPAPGAVRLRIPKDAPWTVCGEEDVLVITAAKAFQRYASRALAPEPSPFDTVREALDERQRGSARELAGVARAARLVRDADHVVVLWSLVKDAYLAEFGTAAPAPYINKKAFLDAVPANAHLLVAFDALALKAYGTRSPEASALAAFLADVFDRGCSLECFSRYPLVGVPSTDPFEGFDEGRRTFRDERGKLRSVRRKKETSGAVSFEAALDRGDFERLVQMLRDGKRRRGGP